MKPTLVLWLGLLSPLSALPASTTLTLVNQTGFNQISVTVDPGFGLDDTETTTLTGTVQAAFNINPANGQTSELTLTNGRANGTDMTFSARALFNVASYTINVTNLSAAIETLVPPGLVTPATGSFAADQHGFEIDQGTISGNTTGLVGNNTINESFTPESPASGTGNGDGTVVLLHTGDSGLYRNYSVTVTLPVAISDTFLAGTTSVAITATGTIRAAGTVQVPKSGYHAWTLAQGIPNAPFNGDPDNDGISNGLLWALGLNANSNPRPYLPRPNPAAPGGFLFALPPGGTAAPILIQSSGNLGTWGPAGSVGPVANPVPPGTSGNVTVAPDSSPRRFIRLEVTEPS
jgi:hypothetical protein